MSFQARDMTVILQADARLMSAEQLYAGGCSPCTETPSCPFPISTALGTSNEGHLSTLRGQLRAALTAAG